MSGHVIALFKIFGGLFSHNEMKPISVTHLSVPGLSDLFHLILHFSSHCLYSASDTMVSFLFLQHLKLVPHLECSNPISFSPIRSQLKCHCLSERLSLPHPSTAATRWPGSQHSMDSYICAGLFLCSPSPLTRISAPGAHSVSYSLQKLWHIVCI